MKSFKLWRTIGKPFANRRGGVEELGNCVLVFGCMAAVLFPAGLTPVYKQQTALAARARAQAECVDKISPVDSMGCVNHYASMGLSPDMNAWGSMSATAPTVQAAVFPGNGYPNFFVESGASGGGGGEGSGEGLAQGMPVHVLCVQGGACAEFCADGECDGVMNSQGGEFNSFIVSEGQSTVTKNDGDCNWPAALALEYTAPDGTNEVGGWDPSTNCS